MSKMIFILLLQLMLVGTVFMWSAYGSSNLGAGYAPGFQVYVKNRVRNIGEAAMNINLDLCTLRRIDTYLSTASVIETTELYKYVREFKEFLSRQTVATNTEEEIYLVLKIANTIDPKKNPKYSAIQSQWENDVHTHLETYYSINRFAIQNLPRANDLKLYIQAVEKSKIELDIASGALAPVIDAVGHLPFREVPTYGKAVNEIFSLLGRKRSGTMFESRISTPVGQPIDNREVIPVVMEILCHSLIEVLTVANVYGHKRTVKSCDDADIRKIKELIEIGPACCHLPNQPDILQQFYRNAEIFYHQFPNGVTQIPPASAVPNETGIAQHQHPANATPLSRSTHAHPNDAVQSQYYQPAFDLPKPTGIAQQQRPANIIPLRRSTYEQPNNAVQPPPLRRSTYETLPVYSWAPSQQQGTNARTGQIKDSQSHPEANTQVVNASNLRRRSSNPVNRSEIWTASPPLQSSLKTGYARSKELEYI